MFPLRDENPTIHKSIITYLIIIINIVVWFFVQGFGFDPFLYRSVFHYGLIPGELLHKIEPGTQIEIARGITAVFDGKPNWYSVFTSMFMHGGWFHILGNMWFLAVFGDNVEDAMGWFKFILFYFLCGIFAATAQIISNPSSMVPMVGASGAISGVMGAYAVLYPRVPVHMLVFFGFFFTRIVIPAFLVLGYWFLIQILSSFFSTDTGGVAVWAHIGGFLSGILLVKLFSNSEKVDIFKNRRGKTDKFFYRYR